VKTESWFSQITTELHPPVVPCNFNMQIAFDDGGFALDDVEKPSLNIDFDTDDAWDDTEILEIFDAAVRSHMTKGQPGKSKKEKEVSMVRFHNAMFLVMSMCGVALQHHLLIYFCRPLPQRKVVWMKVWLPPPSPGAITRSHIPPT
jgi:hypothetical protein